MAHRSAPREALTRNHTFLWISWGWRIVCYWWLVRDRPWQIWEQHCLAEYLLGEGPSQLSYWSACHGIYHHLIGTHPSHDRLARRTSLLYISLMEYGFPRRKRFLTITLTNNSSSIITSQAALIIPPKWQLSHLVFCANETIPAIRVYV